MIVDYLQNYIANLNKKNKHGFCWNFIYARKDFANIQLKKEQKCCVQFILEDWELTNKRVLTDDTDYTKSQDYTFRIFVGLNSKFDIQYHNELDELESEGKYELYIKKVHDYLIDSFENDICLNPNVQLGTWKFKPAINKYDANLDGGYLSGTLIFNTNV